MEAATSINTKHMDACTEPRSGGVAADAVEAAAVDFDLRTVDVAAGTNQGASRPPPLERGAEFGANLDSCEVESGSPTDILAHELSSLQQPLQRQMTMITTVAGRT